MKSVKLSTLQQAILGLAQRNLLAGKDRTYYPEILHEHFGFELKLKLDSHGQHFSRSEIGAKRYASAQASLSRAVRRLEDRGLVTVVAGAYAKWTAVRLTPDGTEAVKQVP